MISDMSHKNHTYLSLLVCALVLPGCAATKLYTPHDFCNQSPNPGMARIVLTRENRFTGSAVSFRILDAEQLIADIGPGDRVCWDRYPGKAVVSGSISVVEKPVYTGRSQFTFEASAGHTYNLNMYVSLSEGLVIEQAESK